MTSVLLQNFRQGFIGMSPLVKILLLVLLVALFLFFSIVLSFLLAVPIFHLSLGELYRILADPQPDTLAVLKFFQVMQSVFLFMIPAFLTAWLFSTNTPGYLNTNVKPSGLSLLLALSSLVFAIPLMNAVAQFNTGLNLPDRLEALESIIREMEDSAEKLTGLFLHGETLGDLAVNLMMIAILPALGEELLFRGVLQRLLTEWTRNSHAGILIGAFVFSFIHFQFYGFIPRFLLGLYFGYLLLWSSSLWIPIAAHFVNNGFAVVYYHFSKAPMGETGMDQLGTGANGHTTVYISAFLTFLLIGLIFMHEKNRKAAFQ